MAIRICPSAANRIYQLDGRSAWRREPVQVARQRHPPGVLGRVRNGRAISGVKRHAWAMVLMPDALSVPPLELRRCQLDCLDALMSAVARSQPELARWLPWADPMPTHRR